MSGSSHLAPPGGSQRAERRGGPRRGPPRDHLYRAVLDRRRRVLGGDHPETLASMNSLAIFYSARGRYAEAEALLREALDTGRRVMGEDHPDTTKTLYNLGCMTALRGDRAGALDWLGQAITHGWSDADKLAQDPDLKSLRGDPGFGAIVARARKNPGR